MIHKKDGVITHDFGGYEGLFQNIREKIGEYEGKEQRVVEVKMKCAKTGELAIVQFTKKALFAKGFFQAIRKVDLNKVFTIAVWGSEENEKISFCGLKQDGYKYEGKRKTIEPDKSFPNYSEVMVSGEKVLDWTAPLKAMDEIIAHITESRATTAPTTAPAEVAEGVGAPTRASDDLPF